VVGILFTLFLNNIAPLFLIALIGWILAKKFSIDIYTLTKINIYIFVPALVFVKIAETEITRDLLKSFFFTLVLMFIMNLIVGGVSRLRKNTPSVARAMKNGVLFYNSGNMGLPLIMLIFNELPQAVSVQIMVMLAQNLTTNTLGLYNANRGNMDVKGSLLQVIKTPSIYAVATGFFFKLLRVDFSEFFLWPAATFLSKGLVPVALLTLGVQLSRVKMDFSNRDVYLTTFIRLIVGPLMAFILLTLFRIEGIMAQVLLISSAVPTAVNTALLAVEYHNEPEFASQVVLTATTISVVTLSIIIYTAQWLF
jgi:predicted permease